MPSSLTHRSAVSSVRTAVGIIGWLWQEGCCGGLWPRSPLRAEPALTLEQAVQSPVLLNADCLQGWRFPTSLDQCLATIVKDVPELKLQFRLEDAGPFQFKLPFHLNPGSLGGGQRKLARVCLKVSSPQHSPVTSQAACHLHCVMTSARGNLLWLQ